MEEDIFDEIDAGNGKKREKAAALRQGARKLAFFVLKGLRHFFENGKCVLCNADCRGSLCEKCRALTVDRANDATRCAVCGRPLVSESEICMRCRQNSLLRNVEKNFALYPYQLWGKTLLFNWKMEKNLDLAEIFAEKLHHFHQSQVPTFAIVPVPPRPKKIRETGWDQIECLAKILRDRFGETPAEILVRHDDRQQKKLSFEERLKNIGRYSVAKNAKVPEKALIFDDIITTGSTLDDCARALREAGCRHVVSFTFFGA